MVEQKDNKKEGRSNRERQGKNKTIINVREEDGNIKAEEERRET